MIKKILSVIPYRARFRLTYYVIILSRVSRDKHRRRNKEQNKRFRWTINLNSEQKGSLTLTIIHNIHFIFLFIKNLSYF